MALLAGNPVETHSSTAPQPSSHQGLTSIHGGGCSSLLSYPSAGSSVSQLSVAPGSNILKYVCVTCSHNTGVYSISACFGVPARGGWGKWLLGATPVKDASGEAALPATMG